MIKIKKETMGKVQIIFGILLLLCITMVFFWSQSNLIDDIRVNTKEIVDHYQDIGNKSLVDYEILVKDMVMDMRQNEMSFANLWYTLIIGCVISALIGITNILMGMANLSKK